MNRSTNIKTKRRTSTLPTGIRLIAVCLFIFISFLSKAQVFPVQVQPATSFPSAFLSDYADPSNLNVRVFLSDVNKTDYAITLHVKLQSEKISIQSKTGISLILQGGQVYFLNEDDLSLLFAPENLLFSSNVPTESRNTLPEGIYTLSFEAFDSRLGTVIVSNVRTDFTIFSINRFDPPMLAQPANKQAFEANTINQNIFFSWTPRQVNFSPRQQVKYRFRLIRVQPVDRNPYDAMNTTIPALIDIDNLDFPVYVYTPADLQLQEGSVYAWQAIAYEEFDSSGVLKKSTGRFKNAGQSEVFSFSVKENCEPVTPISTPIVLDNQVALHWNTDPSHNAYELAYRPFGSSLPWTPLRIAFNSDTLDNTVLQAGTTYEYTVRVQCRNWTEPQYGGTFTLTPPSCPPPSPVMVDNTGIDTKLSWPSVQVATGYVLQYKNKENPAALYSKINLGPDIGSYHLSKLSAGGYSIRLDAMCGALNGEGAFYDIGFNETGIAGPCAIPAPFQLLSERLSADTASLAWTINDFHTGSSITYWHQDSSSVKRTLTATEAISKVKAGSIYDDQLYNYQITYQCGSKSNTTPVGMFRIDGNAGPVLKEPGTADCFPPASLQAEARSTSSAFFEWASVSGADQYQLFYSLKGKNNFIPFNTISKSATLKDLNDSEKYQYMVRSRCGAKYSVFSDTGLVDLAAGKRNNKCDSSAFFRSDKQLSSEIRVSWKFDPANTGYKISYREEAQPPSEEYTQSFTDMDALKANMLGDTIKYTFNNLKSGTSYRFRLQALCGTEEALRNFPIKTSTLPDAKDKSNCGSSTACDKSITTPTLSSLSPGDTIHCADYSIIVTKATAAPSANGNHYSGTGIMAMPIIGISDFVSMQVSFSNILINDRPNACVFDGTIKIDSVNASALPTELRNKVKAADAQVQDAISKAQQAVDDAQKGIDDAQDATQKGIDYFQGGDNVGSVISGSAGEVKTTKTIGNSSVAISGNTVIIGNEKVTVPSFPALIKDATGSVYQIQSTGTRLPVGKYDPSLPTGPIEPLMINGSVVFSENKSATYDFDAWRDFFKGKIQIEREYELLGISYHVPAKLLVPGATDLVNATLTGASYKAANVIFANGQGLVYNHSTSGNNFTITLAGGPAGDAQNIYAWYVDGDKKTPIGKLLAPSYKPQQKQVVIIPVGKSKIDAQAYEEELNEAYAKVGINYTVTVDQSFIDNKDWDLDGDGKVQSSGSKLLSTDYAGEEGAMVQSYVDFKGPAGIDSNTAYFLAVYEVANIEDGLLGKMPAEQQFGFIYTGSASESSLTRTVAHEIGHGAYHLEHTFNSIYLGKDTRGKTDNLMDYNDGLALWKYQWDIIQDPGHVWGALKRDRDAENKKQDEDNIWVGRFLSEIRMANNYVQYYKEIFPGNNDYLKSYNCEITSLKDLPDSKLNTVLAARNIIINGFTIDRIYIKTPSKKEILRPIIESLIKPGNGYIRPMFQNYIQISNTETNANSKLSALISSTGYGNLNKIKAYLEGENIKEKNLLIFVNGYKNNVGILENSNSINKIAYGIDSHNDYWVNIDDKFIKTIETKNTVYADGNFSIVTSNHAVDNNANQSRLSFLSNMSAYTLSVQKANSIECFFQRPGSVTLQTLKLHTTPNQGGFNVRVDNGYIAGQELAVKLQSHNISFSKEEGKIDIVAHSMGYAYALGMIKALKEADFTKNLGRFYIIAPENACSGEINIKEFEQVFQYGSDEKKHFTCEQDGVAPQCAVKGLEDESSENYIRKFIPKQVLDKITRKFDGAHSIENYGWIFDLPKENGGIQKR